MEFDDVRNPVPGSRVELPVWDGEPGLRPGVDLDDKDALMDLLDMPDDEDDPPPE